MTDFGPLIANPKTLLLGAAAQFGIFGTILGALYLGGIWEAVDFHWLRLLPSALSAEQTGRLPFS